MKQKHRETILNSEFVSFLFFQVQQIYKSTKSDSQFVIVLPVEGMDFRSKFVIRPNQNAVLCPLEICTKVTALSEVLLMIVTT